MSNRAASVMKCDESASVVRSARGNMSYKRDSGRRDA